MLSDCTNWFFGRGLSIACNLSWTVPIDWQGLPRDLKVEEITRVLRCEMDSDKIDTSPIRHLLDILAKNTATNRRNRFITTNWDYLLEREIQKLAFVVHPHWIDSSHVFHLNGTVEMTPSNSNRSLMILEEDSTSQRSYSLETNWVYSKMCWDRTFVVVGMSFECEADRFLLTAINRVQDDLPIGFSTWIVVNPDQVALNRSCERIARALPHGDVKPVRSTFEKWLNVGLPELVECGAIDFTPT